MTRPDRASVTSPRPCAGWEHDDDPDPTCHPMGCRRLDENGWCPGYKTALRAPKNTRRASESTVALEDVCDCDDTWHRVGEPCAKADS